MSAWPRFVQSTLGALVAAVLISGCSSGGPSVAPQPPTGSQPAANALRFSLASQSVKMQNRPSITSRNVVYCHGVKNNCYNFQLVTSVALNSDGTFSSIGNTCDSSIFDAPWFIANSTFTLPLSDVSVPYCSEPAGVTMPTPVVGPNSGYYLLRVDIGWFSLDAGALAGPSVVGKMAGPTPSGWYMRALGTNDAFQQDHLYAFFIATFNGNNCPAVPTAAT